jgi:uncharacterized linocin/CFP29 family protein
MVDTPADLHHLNAFARNVPQRFLSSGLNINSLRTNALLRKDEWEMVDRTVVDVSADVLNGIADLRALGLTHNLGGIGVLVSQYERLLDMSDANVDMAAEAEGEEDLVEFELAGVPVPVIHKDFRINIRWLEAARRMGGALDTTNVAAATRKVTEKLEDLLFNGSDIVSRGNAIYGYRTHPDRNTTAGGSWATATNIDANILTALGGLQADGYYGPYYIYVNPAQYTQTLARNTATDRRMLELISGLPGVSAVKVSKKVPAGEVLVVHMSRDVVDLAIGQDIVPVEWDAFGGMVQHFKVMGVMVPRVKAEASGKSGIYHLTGVS